MEFTVSIPNELWKQLEGFAREHDVPPNEVLCDALRAYLHLPSGGEDVTELMNCAIEQLGQPTDGFVAAWAREILRRTEW